MKRELISLFVAGNILAHFDYDRLENLSGVIRIHLVEKKDANYYPKKILGNGKRSLNGFMNPIELQTFPTQGKEVYLLLKSPLVRESLRVPSE